MKGGLYKNNMGKNNTMVVIGVFALIALIGLMSYAIFFKDNSTTNTNTVVPATGCSIAPSFNLQGTDALLGNGNVTPANYQYRVNGKYVGTTYATPAAGAKVEILADPTGYLADVTTIDSVACGAQDVNFEFENWANATVVIRRTDSTTLTNAAAGGLGNETALTAGGSKTDKIEFTGAGSKSTGNLLFYVEMPSNSAANMSSTGATLSCGGVAIPSTTIPNAIGSTNTNAFRTAFTVPAIKSGSTTNCDLQYSTAGTNVLSGVVRTQVFAMQQDLDTDGTFKEMAYDANNVASWQGTSTYAFLLL